MALYEIHVGDVELEFRFTVSDEEGTVDLSTATVLRVLFQKPGGSLLTVPATFPPGTDGTLGILSYFTVPGDVDEDGTWHYQVYVEIGPEQKSSNVGKFRVYPNLPLGV